MRQNDNNNVEETAIKAVAAASKTPFWTAFKVTLGVALAQFVVLIIFLAGLFATLVGFYYLVRS